MSLSSACGLHVPVCTPYNASDEMTDALLGDLLPDLDQRTEGGQQPSSRTVICVFVHGGTGGALPEPYKVTSNRPLMCTFLLKRSETDSMRVV